MSSCWPLQGMSPAQKAVLISLADQANDDGYCWPSVGTISKRTCLSERAVQGAIKWLHSAGLLSSDERRGTSSVYRITPAAYAPPQEMRPADAAPRGAGNAPTPPQMLHPTPADAAPKPSLNRKGNHQGTVIVGADAPKAKPASRATTLPSDFRPDSTAEQIARDFGLDILAEETAFSDYHSAKGTTFKDWQAGFRTWLRNANKFGQRATAARAAPVNKQEALEARNRAVGDAWVAKMQAQQQGAGHAR